MLQKNHLRSRKEKISFLKGLVNNKYNIVEIVEQKNYLFVETDEMGIYFRLVPGEENTLVAELKDGIPVLYPAQKVEEIKSKPNANVSLIEFGTYTGNFFRQQVDLAKRQQYL